MNSCASLESFPSANVVNQDGFVFGVAAGHVLQQVPQSTPVLEEESALCRI
jgi:hypothetical protein